MAVVKISRRTLLLGGVGGVIAAGSGGLWLAVRRQRTKRWAMSVQRAQAFAPSVFLAIDRDDRVTIWLNRSEMGQGVWTSLPMLVAEELDANWAQVRVEQAVLDGRYDFGQLFTAASASVRSNWNELRSAGAAAREMLIHAAAHRWGVRESECRTESGRVIHADGRMLNYGALVDAAAHSPVPWRPRLKRKAEFRLLGKSIPRIDIPDKVSGKAVFGIDVRFPGMLRAVIAKPPTFGGTLQRFEDQEARAVEGVEQVVRIDSGVAVVARDTWSALRGREALRISWDAGPNTRLDSTAIEADLRRHAAETGATVRDVGNALGSFRESARVVEAEYWLPYLAHAPMEPLNCLAHVHDGVCDVWVPTQNPEGVRDIAAQNALLAPEHVRVHVPFLGGGFGRRAQTDEVAAAVELSRRLARPVQVVWSREDDLRHGRHREISHHRMAGVLDDRGLPEAWFHRLITPSLGGRQSKSGEYDAVAVGGTFWPYAIPNVKVEWVSADFPVPIAIWRAIGHSYNSFVVESFLDELATSAGKDPLETRRRLLQGAPRLLACVARVAERARWSDRRTGGRGLGIAAGSSFGSHAAQVAEVSAGTDGRPIVHKVWCAVDCGMVVHPDTVSAQIEGGIAFGLSAALHGIIEIRGGAVKQSNFHDYPLLRMGEMPEIDVVILESGEEPGGVGELAVPYVAPAVANAYFAATGHRVRRLPFSRH